ncbi:hypothetical protein H072_11537 [Dactylellina haptotyla CBS 200.50]|uniref:Uncharacterized protein n=1 Tax=Dactylellina haptotyla (strain CBS 200.50) TaxID=1284197 RepID=S8BIU2_DACHA|nr:hypothetical protein H072_11537 [Dactylellina haptotyla CBS 200.50]
MVAFKALILDIGDVLFKWKAPKDTKVTPKQLHRAMCTLPWFEFERGKISEKECFAQISRIMGILASDIHETIEKAALTLEADDCLVSIIKELKTINGGFKLYAMSNIGHEHYQIIRSKPWDHWSLFEHVFTSAEAGKRKPDLEFYKHVLKEINLEHSPGSVLFVDDKLENVATAQSLGIQAIQFDGSDEMVLKISNIIGDPVARGAEYLKKNAKKMFSTVNGEAVMKENFAQLLILEATGDPDLVVLNPGKTMWNFFLAEPMFTTSQYPDDFDTTTLALLVLGCPESQAHEVMNRAVRNVNPDGIIQLYDDPLRPRVDFVFCVHILSLFHKYHRESETIKTYEWVYQILKNRAYLRGSLYYKTPDYFLWTVGRLITESAKAKNPLPENIVNLFSERCRESLRTSGDALALAMRILACLSTGRIAKEELWRDIEELRSLQCADGGWPFCPMYRLPAAGAAIGNRGLSTALAMKALKLVDDSGAKHHPV